MFPGLPPGFDPSKLDPKLIGEISELMRTLPPPMLMQMQSLMQKSMTGADVTSDMAEFERGLPAGFREKMAKIMYQAHGVIDSLGNEISQQAATAVDSVESARLTILRAVQSGKLAPEAALKTLFP